MANKSNLVRPNGPAELLYYVVINKLKKNIT